MITRETIADLAQRALVNNRALRYRAEEQALDLAAFGERDRLQIYALYEMLLDLERVVVADAALEDPAPLAALKERHELRDLVYAIRSMGANNHDERVAQALHDIRGGALSALFIQLSRVATAPRRRELVRGLRIGTRDHLKIMRNVVRDLDPEARVRDLALIPHSLGELAMALREFTTTIEGQEVITVVDCPDERAIIAETCVECAAVDRVAYNLLNNAGRYASRPAIGVWLTALDHDLHVAVTNTVSDEQRALVEAQFATGSTSLFDGFTTTGSGFGLRIVSDLVARAYGTVSLESLTTGGYVGAKIVEDSFVAWFHWPLSEPLAEEMRPV